MWRKYTYEIFDWYIVVIEDSLLLLFWNGFWDTRDGRLNSETWYLKINFDEILLLVEVHTLAKISFSILRFIKYSLTSSASQTFAPPNLCWHLLRSPILNISIVSFSSNLNALNALSAGHKLVPIDNPQSLNLIFI